MADFLLGTSGYDYPEWKGVFYPPDLKRRDFLPYYSTVFNALELNFSFYGMPTSRQMASFYERSEGRLSFSVKANRSLTHEVGRAWKETAREFQNAVRPLFEKDALLAVLFQFPESFHYTKENRLYLADLLASFRDFPCVVEFRHRGWVRQSVFDGLEERGASVVFCDMPMCHLSQMPMTYKCENGTERRSPKLNPANMIIDSESEDFGKKLAVVEPVETTTTSTPFVGKTAYIRLHGRNAGAWYASAAKAQKSKKSTCVYGQNENAQVAENALGVKSAFCERNGSARYRYDYSDAELSEFVLVIQSALGSGKRTAVFFNNHPDGSGARNAVRLGEMMGLRKILGENSGKTRRVLKKSRREF